MEQQQQQQQPGNNKANNSMLPIMLSEAIEGENKGTLILILAVGKTPTNNTILPFSRPQTTQINPTCVVIILLVLLLAFIDNRHINWCCSDP